MRYGLAQVATVPTPFGDIAYVSGQVAWDADQNIVGAGDIGRQLSKSLETLALHWPGLAKDEFLVEVESSAVFIARSS